MRSYLPITTTRVTRAALALGALTLAALVPAACGDPAPTGASAGRAGAPGTHREYGTPIRLGQGRARSYVVLDRKDGGRALEFGVALDERAMEGLPAHGAGDGPHGNFVEMLLPLPADNPTPFRLVELDWNPMGHGAPHEAPHFDFHFYTITAAERNAIVPTDPQFAAKAGTYPAVATVPPFIVQPAAALGLPPESVAVPRMGMHWIDVRSPELQIMLGNPDAYRPFTKTFIYGSWDGAFIFMEPMITREYIVAKRDATDPAVRDEWVPIPTSTSYPQGGFRPDAYRITYDAQAREYRIALALLPAGGA